MQNFPCNGHGREGGEGESWRGGEGGRDGTGPVSVCAALKLQERPLGDNKALGKVLGEGTMLRRESGVPCREESESGDAARCPLRSSVSAPELRLHTCINN